LKIRLIKQQRWPEAAATAAAEAAAALASA